MVVAEPVKPLFLFAPGAGAPSSHPWMQRWKLLLEQLGQVELFDYDYMRAERKRPDAPAQLIAAHRAALGRMKDPSRVILIGKSMGGRIGCHVSLETQVVGLVCLGYPLCGGGDPHRLRDAVLSELRTPVLFAQGTRDPLCPLDLLEEVMRKIVAPHYLHVVDGGDHSLELTKKRLHESGESQADVDSRTLRAIAEFTVQVMGEMPVR